ncbi:MAG: orotate phosphoribosyltransferase [Pseudanabaenaceae cyanobacterium bins.39]|nr:orotate phosphoribosyltransferase [Pseudanabaenaceae cyanobacterium bins.39]
MEHPNRQKLLDLFCRLAYKSGDFTLSSGQKSTYYINGKLVSLHPFGALWLGQVLLSMLPDETGAVGGLTLGADPIVSAVSVVSAYENKPIPALIVRKQPKGHGTAAWIEGPELEPNTNVVVLEDVVTTGQSALFAVEKLRNAGYAVTHILTLVDRQQGGAELYAQEGLNFASVFTIKEIQEYVGTGQ